MPEADQRLDNTGKDDPVLLFTCATVAALGGLLAIVGNIAGSIVVPGHDFVADTISDLGAGRYEWIQDFALYGFAAAPEVCIDEVMASSSGSHKSHLVIGYRSI